MSAASDELAYYLGRKPSHDELEDSDEWRDRNPEGNLAEYVEAMIEIGAL